MLYLATPESNIFREDKTRKNNKGVEIMSRENKNKRRKFFTRKNRLVHPTKSSVEILSEMYSKYDPDYKIWFEQVKKRMEDKQKRIV